MTIKTFKSGHGRDWFAVERRVFDDPMFSGEAFSRREAWLWLIANAAKADHHARTRGGMVELKRGDVQIGRDHLAKTWCWSESRVRTFLDQLAKSERIDVRQSNGHHSNVAKISNYGRYQGFGSDRSPVDRQLVTSGSPQIASERFKGRQSSGHHPNAANINNYGLHEGVSTEKSPVESPVDRQSVASGSPHPYIEQDTKEEGGTGEAAKPAKASKPKTSKPTNFETARKAIQAFNTAADGFAAGHVATVGKCASLTSARLAKVDQRLRDIGNGDATAGLERWSEALAAIPHD